MEYKFELEPTMEIDRSACINLRGGACPRSDLIYLYGYGEENEYEDKIWNGIITHEHLHDLLHKHNISVDFHHEIIYRMEKYIFSLTV